MVAPASKQKIAGAHYGLKDWLAQRITACIMAAYTILMIGVLLCRPTQGYENWHAIFANGYVRAGTFLFCFALFYHAWVGVRDIFMDYVKPVGIRLTLHVLVIVALVLYAGWVTQILWRL